MTEALKPPVEPYASSELKVSRGHSLHVEEVGRANGVPVVFIHGGPGSGCNPSHRRFFAPDRFRAVLYDQRGAGRSTPPGQLEANTTEHLLADLERLREALAIDRWLLFAGSWGATLALLYAQRFPERILGMVLRGTFLARPGDLAWFFGADGAARVFPEAYERFLEPLAPSERSDPVEGYRKLLGDADPETRLAAARSWSAWESRVTEHNLSNGGQAPPAATEALLHRTRIANHYAAESFFLGEAGALVEPDRLAAIPGSIVHGRRDLVAPVENATALHARWNRAELVVVEDSGHLATEPAIAAATISALEKLAAGIRS